MQESKHVLLSLFFCSIVSKMMIDSELQGSWDQPTRTIVMQDMDATRMQQLAMQFTDKAMVRVCA